MLNWLKSKTIIAALLTLLANALAMAGIEVSSDTLQTALDLVIQLVQVLGPVFAVIGRIVARPTA